MTIATNNGVPIIRDGKVVTSCSCCGGWFCYSPTAGACCNGTQCRVVQQCDCDTEAGEVFKGVGTVCSPNPCVGRCCDQTGYCQEGSEQDCIGAGKVWQQGGVCEPNTCPRPCGCTGNEFVPSQIVLSVSNAAFVQFFRFPPRGYSEGQLEAARAAQIAFLNQITISANPGSCQFIGDPEYQRNNLAPNGGCSPFSYYGAQVIGGFEFAFRAFLFQTPPARIAMRFAAGRTLAAGGGEVFSGSVAGANSEGLTYESEIDVCIENQEIVSLPDRRCTFLLGGFDYIQQCGWNSITDPSYPANMWAADRHSGNIYSADFTLQMMPANPLP
jgi:hypothetical protein